MADDRPTFRNLVHAFTDFLTVAIHTILYERQIYPQSSFLSARKYNFAVRQNRHPKVCEWINDAVTAVENELLKCAVARIAVVIFSKQNKPLERFVFDTSRLPTVPSSEIDTPLERTDRDNEKVAVLPVVDMEEQFRATMSRITQCSVTLQPIPQGCTFTIAIELKDESPPPIGHPQPWVPVEKQLESASPSPNEPNPVPQVQTRPLRTTVAGDMIFESWIEESKTKAQDTLITK